MLLPFCVDSIPDYHRKTCKKKGPIFPERERESGKISATMLIKV